MAESIAIYGDAYRVRARSRELLAEMGADGVTSFRVTDSPNEAFAAGQFLPFLEPTRNLRITGALDPDATKEKPSRKNGVTTWLQMAQQSEELPDTTRIMWIDGAVKPTAAMLKALRNTGPVEHLPALTGADLNAWVREQVKQKGKTIDREATKRLTEAAGKDLWALENEIEKLSLWCARDEITAEAVDEVSGYRDRENIFQAIDALVNGDPGRTCAAVAEIISRGQSEFYVVSMLQRHARLAAIALDGLERNLSDGEMMTALGTTSDYAARKTVSQAKKMGHEGVLNWYEVLCENDESFKTGVTDSRQGLNVVIGKLAATGRSTKQRHPPRSAQ